MAGYEREHSRIVRLLAGTLACGLALYLGAATATAVDEHQDRSSAMATNDFWTTVSDPASAGSGPAQDVAAAIGRQQAADPIDRSDDFIGRPNAHNGVAEELGWMPFDETEVGACDCGPLTEDLVQDLITYDAEGLDAVLRDVPDADLAITDLPFLAELAIVWTLLGSAAMATGLRRHGQPGMTWRRGDGHADVQEVACIAMAPVFMLLFLTIYNRRRLARQDADREQQLAQKGMLDLWVRLGAQIDALDGDTSRDAMAQRARLLQMRRAYLDAADSETAREEARRLDGHLTLGTTDALLSEAQDVLDARRMALDELNHPGRQATR